MAQILHGTADETCEDDKVDDNEVSFRLYRTWVSLILQRYFVQHKATVNWGQPYIHEEGVKSTNHMWHCKYKEHHNLSIYIKLHVRMSYYTKVNETST